MGLKTATVQIADPGSRDHGRMYLLTEMPATQAEKWATRAFLALTRSGVEIPEDIRAAGMAGIAALGFHMLGGLRFEDVEPLMDEMMGCVQIIPDPKVSLPRKLVESDIEEVKTRFKLRVEVFTLHTSFSWPDVVSMLNSTSTTPGSLDTQTSPALSGP